MGLDSERLKHRGRLAEALAAARRLEMSIEGDMLSIRDLLDPFEPIADLRAELAAGQAVGLAGKHAEYLGLLAEIKALKKALG